MTVALHVEVEGEEDMFPLNFDARAVPRVGDEFHYYVDYPDHLPADRQPYAYEDGEWLRLTGEVVSVHRDYRMMRYGAPKMVESVVVTVRPIATKQWRVEDHE